MTRPGSAHLDLSGGAAPALLVALLAALCLALPSSAGAAMTITDFETDVSTTQAGGHPDLTMAFELADPGLPEAPRDITFEAPEGLFANVNAVTLCPNASFAAMACPSDAQIGVITVWGNYQGVPKTLLGFSPVYSLEPGDETTALLGFTIPIVNSPIQIPVSVRTGSDYGLNFHVKQVSQVAPIAGAKIVLWGFPADPSHNTERFPKGFGPCVGTDQPDCLGGETRPNIPVRSFTTNPTVCEGEPLHSTLRVRSYQDPDGVSTATAPYPIIDGCEKVTFQPSVSIGLTTEEADSPTGFNFTLFNPQLMSQALATSQVRRVTVTLPEGLTINPDAADGQTACSDAEARLGVDLPAQCPDSAKIGVFRLINPSLKGPLEGSLYIGQPRPGDQYRILMVASAFGMNTKLGASLRPDPSTGKVEFVTDQLPQIPFSEFQVRLFGSDRGMLATPTHCSVYATTAHFEPWAKQRPDLTSTQVFSITSGPDGRPCPGVVRPFEPRLRAGTSNPDAGAYSDFGLKLDRDDGDQFIRDLEFQMPPGFTGNLRGIPYCSEAQIAAAASSPGRSELAASSCPAASQIGTARVAAGPGVRPFFAHGRLYLAGPFRGAPLSLAFVTPALAGPYDYGTVVVRVALHVDQRTAQVRAASDTVPQIIGGVPLRLRSVEVDINRPRFTINPTSCASFAVFSRGIGDQGTAVDFSSPFTAVNCAALPFRPRMTVRQLGGIKQTKRSRNPRMRFVLRTRPGDANISRVTVTLPKAFAIDQRHLGNICSRAQLERELCAGRQKIGDVLVRTPLLDEPLRGPAYAVSGFGKLPRLAFILNGQVLLVPQGESTSNRRGQLRTVVPIIPDAPIGYFRLDLLGGKRGYLLNTRNLCSSSAPVVVSYRAHSGRTRSERVRPATACGKARQKKRRTAHLRRSIRSKP